MAGDQPRCDLVLGGGGVRGVAHIGALTALEERGFEVVRAAGASAGAIAGAFAVAGVPGSTLRDLFEALDLTSFVTADVLGRLRSRRAVGKLVQRWSEESVEPLAWLTEILEGHGVKTFGDLRIPDADATAPPDRRYRLVVRCLDIMQRRVIRLPWDYGRYDLDPDSQPVAEAVRASMSIPFVYDPVRIGNRDTGRQGLLIDGGLATGFPVDVLDRRDGQPPRWPTFGVRLLSRAGHEPDLPEGGIALAKMVVEALLDTNDLLASTNICDERRTVRVDLSRVGPLDLDVDAEHDLFTDGYMAMADFLQDFDFSTYVTDCRPSWSTSR